MALYFVHQLNKENLVYNSTLLRDGVFCPHDEIRQWNYVSTKNSVTSNCRAVRYTARGESQNVTPHFFIAPWNWKHSLSCHEIKINTGDYLPKHKAMCTKLLNRSLYSGVKGPTLHACHSSQPGHKNIHGHTTTTVSVCALPEASGIHRCFHRNLCTVQCWANCCRYSCCVHLLSWNRFHSEAQYMW